MPPPLGIVLQLCEADLRKPQQIRDMVKGVGDKFGRVDVLVRRVAVVLVCATRQAPCTCTMHVLGYREGFSGVWRG